MKYSESKEILEERKKLLDFIDKHPNIDKIRIDRDLLDRLIFKYNFAIGYNSKDGINDQILLPRIETIDDYENIYKDNNDILNKTIPVKIPVWTGSFLRRIDLSEIDFSCCLWDPEIITEYDIIWAEPMEDLEYQLRVDNIPLYVDPDSFNRNYVDLSYTNANIDFKKSFNAFAFIGNNSLYNCNFEGVDLSKSNSESINSAYNCNLSKTNFKVSNEDYFYSYASNLENLNLKGIETCFDSASPESIFFDQLFEYSNIRNTGLTIHVSKYYNPYSFSIFANLLDNGFYNGCKLVLHNCDNLYNDEDNDLPDDYPHTLK